MRRLGYIILFVVLSACEKDQVIPDQPDINNLADYIADMNTSTLSSQVWAFAGNHPSFERAADELPYRIQVYKPDSTFNFCFFESDSIQYADSLELYRKTDAAMVVDKNGLFARFELKDQPKRNKVCRIAFQTNDSVYLSEPIFIKNLTTSLKTSTIERITVNVSKYGLADIKWSGTGSVVTDLVWIEDRSGDAFCAVYTNSKNFLFYDLRNVTTNLITDLYDPRLILGETYTVHIAGIDDQKWARVYRKIEFKADTFGLQEF